MTYPNATHYSPHFSRRELDCRCGCKTPPDVERELAILARDGLEPLRELAGEPLLVNCAYRCPPHNAAVGGVSGSFHTLGKATDLDRRRQGRAGVERLATLAAKVPAFARAGIGRYFEQTGLFVHVDRGDRYWRGVDGR